MIKYDSEVRIVQVFDELKKGGVALVPFLPSKYRGIRAEAARRNRAMRLVKKKRTIDLFYRVSIRENPGYITIIRLK